LLVCSLLVQAQADRFTARLEPALTRIVREQNLTGLAVGIVEGGRLTYAKGLGVMKVGERDRLVTPDTLFHMASITKPFVMTSVMQLVERGKIQLDAPLVQYVPYFRLRDPRYRAMTVRQMLTHTSGMPDVQDYRWNQPEYDEGALERYVRSLHDQPLRWEPGSRFAYSNMAYEVLGDLVAKVSGQSFEDYVTAQILKPLGMSSSTLLVKEADPARLAAGHMRTKSGAVQVVPAYPYNRAHTPSSNLHSNVVDMARWAMATMNRGELDGHRILQTATYDIIWTPAARRDETVRVGLSWFLSEIRGQKAVFHGGGDDGFRSRVVVFPDRKVAIVYMTNCDYVDLRPIDDAMIAVALGSN
jgi:CubicO group peptidase (beta-lactamase class C family)